MNRIRANIVHPFIDVEFTNQQPIHVSTSRQSWRSRSIRKIKSKLEERTGRFRGMSGMEDYGRHIITYTNVKNYEQYFVRMYITDQTPPPSK